MNTLAHRCLFACAAILLACSSKHVSNACGSDADCSATGSACLVGTCSNHLCTVSNAPAATACSDTAGRVCNDDGLCVECLTLDDCPAPASACLTRTCTDHVCGVGNAPKATACNDSGGTKCDDNGHCATCLSANDCPATASKCELRACTQDGCVVQSADRGASCNDHGGSACDGAGGCVVSACNNGTKDGTETATDCGGDCSPCPDGSACQVPGDCTSGLCTGSVCAERAQGAACSANSECASHHCVGSVCCESACTGTCKACTAALTGGADGSCLAVTAGTTAPAGQCTMAPPCGNDGKCAAGGVCEVASSTTACGSNTCSAAHFTTAGTCSGTGTCGGASGTCAGSLACASPTACLLSCATNGDCTTNACDTTTSACVADQCFDEHQDGSETDSDCGGPTCAARCVPGKMCVIDADCTTGHTCPSGMCI